MLTAVALMFFTVELQLPRLALRHLICENYIWVSSILGAVLHNMGQITAAVLITGSIAAAYLPVLLVTGCAAGLFTGLCAQMMIHRAIVMKIGN